MYAMSRSFKNLCVAFLFFAIATQHSISAAAALEDLHIQSNRALSILVRDNIIALMIAKRAKAVLVFPNMVKQELFFGSAYGEGLLKQKGFGDSYYKSVTASLGWTTGTQNFSYVVFLMSNAAIDSLRVTHGMEIGRGPTVVVIHEGFVKYMATSLLKNDAYAFVFDQDGLMASLSLEGTKISSLSK
jgi:lipid-binding SYLF domain-containing protein